MMACFNELFYRILVLPRDVMCMSVAKQWMGGWVSVTVVYCVKTAEDTAIVAIENANRKPNPSLQMVPF